MQNVKVPQNRIAQKKKLISFSFGKNWEKYLKKISKEKILEAIYSLKKFIGDIKNKNILDVGCGSGIFSFAMYILGAKKIVSFDVDQYSVECTKSLRDKVKSPEKWNILYGSILDKKFILKLEKFDIVYSWGVLHHTGKMWEAINNITSLVKDGGLLFISIYNKVRISYIWLRVKEFYNINPLLGKIFMNFITFILMHFISPIIRIKNPFRLLKDYIKARGMHPFVDIKDWLGGYPYEFATFEEVKNFFQFNHSDFLLIKYSKGIGTGINEFLFKKKK
ncbi:MAG: class I SAM-dependent methyltransferase [Promethearchaeota archaeon]